MARSVLHGSIFSKAGIVLFCILVFICVSAQIMLAQHVNHVGTVVPHPPAPPISHMPIARPPIAVPATPYSVISHPPGWPHTYVTSPVGAFIYGGFRHPPRRPWPPILIFGLPFPGFGPGWGFNSCWWANCNVCWNEGLAYSNLPFYQYSFGNYIVSPTYEPAPYIGGEERPDLPQLFLKDGSVYNVTDYWLIDGQLHFTIMEDEKSVEHTIAFDELDLQRTIDVNTRRGFRFILRNEPLDQYLRDHPDSGSPPNGSS